jgi:hypothetical protein
MVQRINNDKAHTHPEQPERDTKERRIQEEHKSEDKNVTKKDRDNNATPEGKKRAGRSMYQHQKYSGSTISGTQMMS